ncbi:MAG: hypothetical protein WC120_00270 [Parcubacteria group bacterium]
MPKLKRYLKNFANTLVVIGGLLVVAVCFSRIFLGELTVLAFVALFFAACCPVAWIWAVFSQGTYLAGQMEEKDEQ